MDLNEALQIVKAAGYRVTKPKKNSRGGPTCVTRFEDGVVCRMSVATDRNKPDFLRGINVCIAAWQMRQERKIRAELLPDMVAFGVRYEQWAEYRDRRVAAIPVPKIIRCHYEEQDGTVLAETEVAYQ